MNAVTEEIKQLKKEKNAVILAHYYVEDAVQEIADYIGDSYYLSRLATETTADVVVFCGVGFMGESAKVLNPGKKVLMPDMSADCPMAHMADIAGIEKLRAEYEDLAVVCYINSTAELKAHADVCVTSSNALKIVKALPNKHILFIPDDNLGHFIAEQVPEKEFLYQIIDEAQYIKNHTTAAAKSVKVIHSQTRYALTGTPIENRNVFRKCRHWQIM